MLTTLFSLSLLLALIRSVVAQSDFMIDTPNFVQCQSAQITWTSTNSPPYDLLIVSADDQCGPALEDLGNHTSTALTWTVNLAAGTRVVLSLEDAAGNEAWSGTITVDASNDSSCLMSNPSSTPKPSGTSSSSRAKTSSSPSPSTTFAPAGAAGAGLVPTSDTASMRPLNAVTLLGSAVVAFFAFVI